MTDYDLMGTRVFGSKDLIDTLRAAPDIETLDWHRLRLRPPAPPRAPSRLELRVQKIMAEQDAANAQKPADTEKDTKDVWI
ncbi:hypothetical protein [Arthrobacter pascens]|uniref:hypothetical protein n=1 Tax=Arthrobacter pascens TaxID=1677 RepID=UPI0027D8A5EB|nr:hypothetical protein [Arthrobacter pascens]